MLPKDQNVTHDTKALAMLSFSNLFDQLDNPLQDAGAILSENYLPVALDSKE